MLYVSIEASWKSDADVQLALTGVYKRLQVDFFGHYKLWLDTYSDNALDSYSFFGFGNLSQGIVNSSNVSTAFYDFPYQGIAGCNFF